MTDHTFILYLYIHVGTSTSDLEVIYISDGPSEQDSAPVSPVIILDDTSMITLSGKCMRLAVQISVCSKLLQV